MPPSLSAPDLDHIRRQVQNDVPAILRANGVDLTRLQALSQGGGGGSCGGSCGTGRRYRGRLGRAMRSLGVNYQNAGGAGAVTFTVATTTKKIPAGCQLRTFGGAFVYIDSITVDGTSLTLGDASSTFGISAGALDPTKTAGQPEVFTLPAINTSITVTGYVSAAGVAGVYLYGVPVAVSQGCDIAVSPDIAAQDE